MYLVFATSFFYHVQTSNYLKYREIKDTFIKHPELIPEKDFAKATAFWYSNVRAASYWLQAVQYIWSNVISHAYKKYLFKMLDLVTELNPYFEHPYLVWQLLIPWENYRYEDLSNEEVALHLHETELLSLKWIDNFCNKDKLGKIRNEYNLSKLWTDDVYKNPCRSYLIPYYLAYIYYFYMNNSLEASYYYKVSSAHEGAVSWAKIMAAIMQWKWWKREKSIEMFVNLSRSLDTDWLCTPYGNYLENTLLWINNGKIILSWKVIKDIEINRKKTMEILDKYAWEWAIADTHCSTYLNKAVREFNLIYIEEANRLYKEHSGVNVPHAELLFEKWFIDYLPVDFQQYDGYGIIYYYNTDINNFDYQMWEYKLIDDKK